MQNLIKDRMERSGMRWTEQMAEAVVQLKPSASPVTLITTGNSTSNKISDAYPAVWSIVPKSPHPF